MGTDKRIVIAAVAVVAVLLQVMLAPYIAIMGIVPNLVAVAAVIMAVVRPDRIGCIVPFLMGLFFDLFSGNAVGPMAFTLTLTTFLAARLYIALNNDTALMAILVAVAALLMTEIMYGLFMVFLGYDAGVLGALAYRALPIFLYDFVLTIVLFLPLRRLLAVTAPVQSSITRLR